MQSLLVRQDDPTMTSAEDAEVLEVALRWVSNLMALIMLPAALQGK